MPETKEELKKQIEAAFRYRGHVTLNFSDGKTIEGYVYNREFDNAKLTEDNFIDVFLKGSGDSARFKIADLKSVLLTGVDEAEGKSYQDWMKKQEAKKANSH